MKKPILIPLILMLGLSHSACATQVAPNDAPLFNTPRHGQQSKQVTPVLLLAQVSEEDKCFEKCEQELIKCHESGKTESECKAVLGACQQACEE